MMVLLYYYEFSNIAHDLHLIPQKPQIVSEISYKGLLIEWKQCL